MIWALGTLHPNSHLNTSSSADTRQGTPHDDVLVDLDLDIVGAGSHMDSTNSSFRKSSTSRSKLGKEGRSVLQALAMAIQDRCLQDILQYKPQEVRQYRSS